MRAWVLPEALLIYDLRNYHFNNSSQYSITKKKNQKVEADLMDTMGAADPGKEPFDKPAECVTAKATQSLLSDVHASSFIFMYKGRGWWSLTPTLF